jgi:hypothetical protein
VRRRLAVAAIAAPLLVGGAGVAVASGPPQLQAGGEPSVEGTTGTAVFEIADRTIRQIRYGDRGELVYTFDLANDGPLPVTVKGLGDSVQDPRLFDFLSLQDGSGAEEFTIGAGESERVSLTMAMTGCETLSARAGSIVDEIAVRTVGPVGLGGDDTVVTLPEEIRAGSPREAGCANATASSRSPG